MSQVAGSQNLHSVDSDPPAGYTATIRGRGWRPRVLILTQDLNIRMINAATGELLRELTLDPTRDYQPAGSPKGPTRKNRGPVRACLGKFLARCRTVVRSPAAAIPSR